MLYVLDRYIIKTIFNIITMILFVLLALSGIIKFIEQLRKVSQGGYSLFGAGFFTLLSIPKDIESFFPMAALLGSLLGLGFLVSHGELVVMQAAGFSRFQIVGSVVKITIPLMFFIMAISEWVAPVCEEIAYNYRAKAIYGGSVFSTQHGLWVKDSNDFIFIKRVFSINKLAGVSIYHLNESGKLQSLRYAVIARFVNNNWILSQVKESNLTNNKKIIDKSIFSSEWKTNLTPDKLGVVALEPNSLSISGLSSYINYLKCSGQESTRYQLNMWSKIFLPFSVLVMVFMALSFIFGPLQSVSMGIRIITGISFGFFFYVLNQIFKQLSLVYNIFPIIGALLPSLIFLIISIIILLKLR